MLAQADNDIITRVTPGTPMGDLLRRYWIPFLFSNEVVTDGAPERVRLLGEDLLAFRDSDGRIGLIEEQCPHRCASLYFGRNEDCGIRCLYHGWKFDRNGTCVDLPSEPPESTFRDKIRITAYPCVERSGFVWTYMGPGAPPALPALEWLDLPEDHHVAGKRVQPSNWVQAMEGEVDQSHVSYVHSSSNGATNGVTSRQVDEIRAADKHPRFEVVETPYGTCIGSGRETPEGKKYWRLTQHLMPFYTLTGPYGKNPRRTWRSWIPIDDTNTLVMGMIFHPLRPITDQERNGALTKSSVWNIAPELRAPATSQAFGKYRPIASMGNDFHQDREVQRTQTFSGIPEFWAQDAAMQISMGPIANREREHLGTSDLGIIAVRRRLLNAAKALRDRNEVPHEISHPEVYAVRGDAILIDTDASWFDSTAERRVVVAGTNPDCP
ncbi:MAG: Rieske 2Fe-2S domain-containing protein [Candidatus Lustribacter sp.]